MSAKDKVVIVTGAAKNIGLQTAIHLAKAGAKVAIVGRSATALEEARKTVGAGCFAVAGHVTKPEDVDRILAAVAKHFGGIDGIVNNAGVAYPNRIEKLDVAQVQEQIAVNLLAPILTCRAIIPYLRKRGGGRIINISSATTRVTDAFAHLSIYAATKAGLERFGEDLRLEVRADNIGVTTFIAGDTATGFGAAWDPQIVGEAYAEWLNMGKWFAGMMDPAVIGQQIAQLFALPDNCAIEFAMMRPVGRMPKVMEEDLKKPGSN